MAAHKEFVKRSIHGIIEHERSPTLSYKECIYVRLANLFNLCGADYHYTRT